MKSKIIGISIGAAILEFGILVFLDSVFGWGTWVGAWTLVIVGSIIGYGAFTLAVFGRYVWAIALAFLAVPFGLTVFWVANSMPMNAFPVGAAFTLLMAMMLVGFRSERKSCSDSGQGDLTPQLSPNPGSE